MPDESERTRLYGAYSHELITRAERVSFSITS